MPPPLILEQTPTNEGSKYNFERVASTESISILLKSIQWQSTMYSKIPILRPPL